MTTDLIRYDLLVQDALRSVVQRVLSDAARDGLPGEHHFYVSFRTDKPGVRISSRLRERYPKDMTIVLQHQFDALTISDHAFEVGLSFSGVAERLRVPFAALTGFFDPSVQFGLKFEGQEDDAAAAEGSDEPASNASVTALAGPVPKLALRDADAAPAADGKAPKKGGGKKGKAAIEAVEAVEASAEVVSLDAFRKKS